MSFIMEFRYCVGVGYTYNVVAIMPSLCDIAAIWYIAEDSPDIDTDDSV